MRGGVRTEPSIRLSGAPEGLSLLDLPRPAVSGTTCVLTQLNSHTNSAKGGIISSVIG